MDSGDAARGVSCVRTEMRRDVVGMEERVGDTGEVSKRSKSVRSEVFMRVLGIPAHTSCCHKLKTPVIGACSMKLAVRTLQTQCLR